MFIGQFVLNFILLPYMYKKFVANLPYGVAYSYLPHCGGHIIPAPREAIYYLLISQLKAFQEKDSRHKRTVMRHSVIRGTIVFISFLVAF